MIVQNWSGLRLVAIAVLALVAAGCLGHGRTQIIVENDSDAEFVVRLRSENIGTETFLIGPGATGLAYDGPTVGQVEFSAEILLADCRSAWTGMLPPSGGWIQVAPDRSVAVLLDPPEDGSTRGVPVLPATSSC